MNGDCTRCDAVKDAPFADVPVGAFYFDPVEWAVQNGVTTGATATTFNPNGNCQRGQVVTFLWRAAGSPEPTTSVNPFTDLKETDFYYKAVLWAVEKGITNGLSADTFGPFALCNRAQVVTFLWRAQGSPESTATVSFTDVKAGQFYSTAVAWAVEKGITNGISASEFGVGGICNRAQVITFLYRAQLAIPYVYPLGNYANVIDQVSNGFSDCGIWLKYWLHSAAETAKFGGFPGPKLMRSGIYLSPGGSRLVLTGTDGNTFDLSRAQATVTSYPGRLVQSYTLDGITLTLTLICVSDRSAMVYGEIMNDTDQSVTFQVSRTDSLSAGTLTAKDDAITVDMDGEYFDIRFDRSADITINGRSYTADLGTITVAAGEKATLAHTESYVFDYAEKTAQQLLMNRFLSDPAPLLEANADRWMGYLENILKADLSGTISAGQNAELDYKRAAAKAIMVLTGNLRSAAGQLDYGAHQPFGDSSVGFWAWDSWKHVVATSSFDPERAKEELRCLFSYQIQPNDSTRPQDAGAIVDVINFYGINNDRDSKPPLSGWAIYNYYAETGDFSFLEEMYPKLTAYHSWWYTNRDIDGNGIAEFGAMQSPYHHSATELDADGDPKPDVEKILLEAAYRNGCS